MTNLTEDVARREVLEQFASLTPHKAGALDRRFTCKISTTDTGLLIEASYVGRQASMEVPADALEWSLDRFSEEIAKPLAQGLYSSKDTAATVVPTLPAVGA